MNLKVSLAVTVLSIAVAVPCQTQEAIPGIYFKTITDPNEISAFETRAKELTTTMTLEKFAKPFLSMKGRESGTPAMHECHLERAGASLHSYATMIIRGGETPLTRGFTIKTTYHLEKRPDVVRYYKFLPEKYKPNWKTMNINPEKDFEEFSGVDVVILLDNPNYKFKIEGTDRKHE